ncbi:MAG: VWA domain-containing protein [Kiritimatiellae bacterium]|nr:VWA domain-containing protein [Kiritimatiellia bacterium]
MAKEKQQTDDIIGGSGRWTAFLSGVGYYKLSVKRRKMLAYVLVGSLLLHVVGLLFFQGYIVMTSKEEVVTVFKTPPPARTYEPRKLEHKVKLQKRQRSSSRPAMMPRMVSMKMSDLALPEIKVDPKLIHTTFQPKFKAVAGKGMGAGLGTGYGTHGFGAGVSTVNFFGIRARGERIAILVDVSVSMVEDEMGGVAGYMRVKQRVEKVIDALSEMSMFSLIVFADAASSWESKMMVANADNKKKAKLYLRPFNTEGNWGLSSGNIRSSSVGVSAAGGTTRLDLALTGAVQQYADTILVISDGLPMVKKRMSADAQTAHAERMRQWNTENAGAMTAWNKANAAYQASGEVTQEKVWVPGRPARAAIPAQTGRMKEGQRPRAAQPARAAVAGHWGTVSRHTGRGHRPGNRPQAPTMPKLGNWTLADFVEHLTLLQDHLYKKKGKKAPAIHCIGYQIDKEGSAFLRKLSKQYHGQYRRVSRLK